MPAVDLHLILTYAWFDKIVEGDKTVEYRTLTPYWTSRIWTRRYRINYVRFQRGYTSDAVTCRVNKIDVGSCPYAGWAGQYFRIHFEGPHEGKP